VHVVEDEDEVASAGDGADPSVHGVEDLVAVTLDVGALGRWDAAPFEHLGNDAPDDGSKGAHISTKQLRGGPERITTERLAKCLGGTQRLLVPPAVEDEITRRVARACDLGCQRRLPDAGLAGDEHQELLARRGSLARRPGQIELWAPTDERRGTHGRQPRQVRGLHPTEEAPLRVVVDGPHGPVLPGDRCRRPRHRSRSGRLRTRRRDRRSGPGRGDPRQGRIVVEDRPFEIGHLGAGGDAELLVEHRPKLRVAAQRLGL
jgi:hypothetical protein